MTEERGGRRPPVDPLDFLFRALYFLILFSAASSMMFLVSFTMTLVQAILAFFSK